jgi:hypothetical protein
MCRADKSNQQETQEPFHTGTREALSDISILQAYKKKAPHWAGLTLTEIAKT